MRCDSGRGLGGVDLKATFREAISSWFLPRTHQPELVDVTMDWVYGLCLGFRGASSTSIQPHLRDVADAMEGVKAADSVLDLFHESSYVFVAQSYRERW